MRKFAVAFVCLFLFFLTARPFAPASAEALPYFTFSLDKEEASAGELVRLNVKARDVSLSAAGFRAEAFYDEDSLSFVGVETSSAVKGGTVETNSASDPVCCVYVCDPDKGYAPALTGTVLTFVFQVKSGAEAGQSALSAKIDEICDFDGNPVEPDCGQELELRVTSSPSDIASLAALVPSVGRLQPEFSSDVSDYNLYVGSEVKSITFEASAAHDGAVKVNRKTLGAAGTDTAIAVTVTSADKSNSSRYSVIVHRETASGEIAAVSSQKGINSASKSGGRLKSASEGKQKDTEGRTGKTEKASDFRTRLDSGRSRGGEQARNAESDDPAQMTMQSMGKQEAAPGERPSVAVEGNQMPSFLTGLLAAAFLLLLGIILSMWLSHGKKTKQP